MNVNNDFHPDDIPAHELIKRLCGIPSETTLTNRDAIRHALKLTKRLDFDLSDADDDIITQFIQSVL